MFNCSWLFVRVHVPRPAVHVTKPLSRFQSNTYLHINMSCSCSATEVDFVEVNYQGSVNSRRDGKKTRGNVSVGFAKDALAAPPLSPPHRRSDDESVNAPPSALRRSNCKRTERRFSFPPCGQAGGSRPSKRKL